jgi:hypothetical protein
MGIADSRWNIELLINNSRSLSLSTCCSYIDAVI